MQDCLDAVFKRALGIFHGAFHLLAAGFDEFVDAFTAVFFHRHTPLHHFVHQTIGVPLGLVEPSLDLFLGFLEQSYHFVLSHRHCT